MQARYCKIGTVPMLVYVDARYKVQAGKRIRFRETAHGSKWQFARVEIVHKDGWFLATL